MLFKDIVERAQAGPLVIAAADVPNFGQVCVHGFYRIEPREGGGLDWYWYATESEAREWQN